MIKPRRSRPSAVAKFYHEESQMSRAWPNGEKPKAIVIMVLVIPIMIWNIRNARKEMEGR